MKRTSFLVFLFLIAWQISFAQIGIGPSVTVTDRIEALNLSIQTSPLKNYGLNFKQSFGSKSLGVWQFESNLTAKRRFFKTDFSNLYIGLGGTVSYQKYESKNYYDWGFNIPVGIEIFPNPQNRRIGITVESGLFYKTFKKRGGMETDQNRFGGYGGLTLHYYFGGKKK